MRLEGIEEHEEKTLLYRVRDPKRFEGKNIVILGGGDSALDWVLELQPKAASMTIVHRREEYRGAPASVEKMKALIDKGAMRELINCDYLLVFWGLAPKLGPIAEWGLDLNRKTVNVDTEKFETNIPGIYAIGDINYYPGKKKLILSGFHEAALAAFAAKERLEPEKKAHLQYTTTSPLMHKRLGL
jgi:thioredoxin reductase (NADPH)